MLLPLGWDEQWSRSLHELHPGAVPGRVLQHHGAGLVIAGPTGTGTVMFTQRLDPEPTVGDWVALLEGDVVGVLPRRSLLRRHAAHGEGVQALAANIDRVLLVCGLDRPIKDGRIQRGTAIARDAGADPVIVLTKAEAGGIDRDRIDPQRAQEEALAAHPGLEVILTSVEEGIGLDDLDRVVAGRTVALLGESGAGKSTIVNALLGDRVEATGAVRAGDAKGRHTTTSRQLHLLPNGGIMIDSPGIRAVGLVADAEASAVADTFADLDELADACRFHDCQHDGQPGCAVERALADGSVDPGRVGSWRRLTLEAESAAARVTEAERRRPDRGPGPRLNRGREPRPRSRPRDET